MDNPFGWVLVAIGIVLMLSGMHQLDKDRRELPRSAGRFIFGTFALAIGVGCNVAAIAIMTL